MKLYVDTAYATHRRVSKPTPSAKDIRNCDHCLVFRRDNRRSITIGDLKTRRLEAKNNRRQANRLPPKSSYAEI